MELTQAEKNAINTLHRLSKRWPKSLWLFADGNGLRVMKCGKGGERVYIQTSKFDGGVDPAYMVDDIDIPNDGGDW